MNNIYYQEKFVSWPIIGFILIIDLLILVSLRASLPSIFLVFVSFFVILNTYSLNIEVEGNGLYYTFGIGLLAFSLPANKISGFDIQDINSLLAWLYNPKGTQSLVIKLKDNRAIRLPTHEPKKIISFLQNKI